jgi:hypothetical protein
MQAYQTVHNNLATFVVFHGVIVKISADIGQAPAARERQIGGFRSRSRPKRRGPLVRGRRFACGHRDCLSRLAGERGD